MVLSLSIGTGFIIWNLNFAESGSKEMMKDFLRQYSGQYVITNAEYYKKSNRKEFDNYRTLKDSEITDKTLMEKSARRVTAPVFISGEKKTLGVLLTGIDVAQELKLSTIHDALTVGRYLDPNGNKEIIIGKKFAARIEVELGDQVATVGQALDGSVANELMTVVGFLDFGGGDLEETLAFTQLSTAQEFMVMTPETYHQRVSFDMDNMTLPQLQNLAVTAWSEILPEISVSVKFIDNFTWVVSVIIVLVVSLGLSNTLMITFFEREQEFQCLNIIGARTRWITCSLMIEVFIMGPVAVMIGAVLGYIMTFLCHIYPINIQVFTNGKPIIMGGMVLKPLVKLYSVPKYYWQVPMMIYFFLSLTMIYPLIRVINRSKNAI